MLLLKNKTKRSGGKKMKEQADLQGKAKAISDKKESVAEIQSLCSQSFAHRGKLQG
jgi:hypothetical protein